MWGIAEGTFTVAWIWHASRLGLCGVVLLATMGCAGSAIKKTAHLQGVVTIAGHPLPDDVTANMSIRPTGPGQGRAAGAMIVAGKYDCADAPLGKVKVFLDIQHKTGKMITESDGVPFHEMRSLIAPKYASGIDIEITGDNTSQNFDLESI